MIRPRALSARKTLWPNSIGLSHLAALDQVGVRLEDRVDLLGVGDLLAFEHAAAGLVDDAICQAAIVLDLFAQRGDGQVVEQVLAAGVSGLLERRSGACHDFLGDADELAVLGGLLPEAAAWGVIRWIACMRRRAARVRLRKPSNAAPAAAEPAEQARDSTRTASHSNVLSVGWWMSVCTTVVSTRSFLPSSSPRSTAAFTTSSLTALSVAGVRRTKARWKALCLGTGRQ